METTSRLQEIERPRVKAEVMGGVGQVCSRYHAKGYHRPGRMSIVNLKVQECEWISAESLFERKVKTLAMEA